MVTVVNLDMYGAHVEDDCSIELDRCRCWCFACARAREVVDMLVLFGSERLELVTTPALKHIARGASMSEGRE